MRLSPKHIAALQKILKERYGLDYTEEQSQQVGLAIMRFVISKELRAKTREKADTKVRNEV